MYLIKKTFLFAHRGVEVEEFVASDDPVYLTDECAEVALAEGWAELFKPAQPEKTETHQTDAEPPAKTKPTKKTEG